MEIEKCNKQSILSIQTTEICRKSCISIAHLEELEQKRGLEEGTFTSKSLLGYFLTTDTESWSNVVLSVPLSFGVISSAVKVHDPEENNKFNANVSLYFAESNQKPHRVWRGNLIQNTDDEIIVEEEQDHTQVASYDWNCLKKCAPACLTCTFDIQCWVICAGACVISCAL
jgi:hypothetical protein